MKPYPLKFRPDMQARIWGGRSLQKFGFDLPEGRIGEAWMIADHPNGISEVRNGELAGRGLDHIREAYGDRFFGTKAANLNDNIRFPLLVKLLDCNDDLSIQVHPNDHYPGLPIGERGKTEMWYVMEAKPGAQIIYGLKEGITRQKLEAAMAENRVLDSMQAIDVEAGDSLFIPAGTVHALGKGIVVAEIQQNSDMTYRLYDYDRPGLDGKARELHIEESLDVISYTNEGASFQQNNFQEPGKWLPLAQSEYFIVERGIVDDSWSLSASRDSFTALLICDGQGKLNWEGGSVSLEPGEALLLPANLGSYHLEGAMTLLRTYLP